MKTQYFRVMICLVLGLSAVSHAAELVLSSTILKAKDSLTYQDYIQQKHKIRVYPRVVVRASDVATSELRDWMSKNLPATMMGYFVREDKATGKKFRFRPIAFKMRSKDLYCTKANSPDFETCQVEYRASLKNMVDLDAGSSGQHMVSLIMVPPRDLRMKSAQAKGQAYYVIHSRPQLSSFAFAGLPQH